MSAPIPSKGNRFFNRRLLTMRRTEGHDANAWSRSCSIKLGSAASSNYDKARRLWHGVDFGSKARFIPAWGNAPGIRVVSDHERQRRDPSGSMKTDVELCADMMMMGRAFSPYGVCVAFPGALPQAGLRTPLALREASSTCPDNALESLQPRIHRG